jgi:hypothetical protein
MTAMPSHAVGKRLYDDLYVHLSSLEFLQDADIGGGSKSGPSRF